MNIDKAEALIRNLYAQAGGIQDDIRVVYEAGSGKLIYRVYTYAGRSVYVGRFDVDDEIFHKIKSVLRDLL